MCNVVIFSNICLDLTYNCRIKMMCSSNFLVHPIEILQPVPITSSAATKLECNGLSQFNEDTGGHSVLAGEFNLTAFPLNLGY